MIVTLTLTKLALSLFALPEALLFGGQASAGYVSLRASMPQPGIVRTAGISVSWSGDRLNVSLADAQFSTQVSCPGKGRIFDLEVTEANATVGVTQIGVGGGYTVAGASYEC